MLKSKFILSAVALSTFASFAMADDAVVEEKDYGVYGYASIDVASACISGSGAVTTDRINFQPCVGVGGNLFGWLPMEFSMWGAYTINDSYYGTGFAEVDLSLIHAKSFDSGFGYSVALTSWEYPADGYESDFLLETVVSQNIADFLKASFEVEWMLSGSAEKDFRLMPAITAFGDLTDDISASARFMMFYKVDNDGEDGFSNWNIKLAVSGYGFTAYMQWFKDIEDAVYGDQVEDFVYGISYGFDF